MVRFTRPLVATLLALCACASFASRSIAPPEFNKEMMQTSHDQDGHRVALGFWLSTQMFRNSLAGQMKPEEIERVAHFLRGYAIYAIMDASLDGEDASIVPFDRGRMRASARLRLGDRAPRAPIPESELPKGVRAATQVLKPLMTGMLGKFGDAMEFVVFDDADEHGDSMADPRARLPVTLSFDQESFTWRLPLVSLQPVRVDPETGDTFPSDFDFNPFTGTRLEGRK